MADDKKQGRTSGSHNGRVVTGKDHTAACSQEIKRSGVYDGVRVYSNTVRNTMPAQTNPSRDPGRGGGTKDEE